MEKEASLDKKHVHKLTPNGRVRYTIDFNPELFGRIEDLSDRLDSTYSEQLRRGMRLLLDLEEARANKKPVIIKIGDTEIDFTLLV